jgi:hypothetical protein
MARERYRTPFGFHTAYCGGRRGIYGWEANDTTSRARTELKARLEVLMIQRSLTELWGADAPQKIRQVIRYDLEERAAIAGDESILDALKQQARAESHFFHALNRVLEAKLPDVCESIFEDLCVGAKVVVWGLSRESVELATDAIEKMAKSREYSALMRQLKLGVWATHGDAGENMRHEAALEFRQHDGPAVIVATMDCMPEGISLGPVKVDGVLRPGASIEHFMQIHYNPTTMIQAENRPILKDGVEKVRIVYHIAAGTREERLEQTVLPKVETLAAMMNTDAADDILSAFAAGRTSLNDLLNSLVDAMPENTASDIDLTEENFDVS